MSDDDPYVYPGTSILRNKLEIQDAAELDRHERRLVAARMDEGPPPGDFDLRHLQSIHHHLFQDVYDWAGQVRTVELNKGGDQFQFRQYIETGMADVHNRLVDDNYLRETSPQEFAAKAGRVMGDVNYIHPFREGNGRTQMAYLDQLAEQAGHTLNVEQVSRDAWITASQEAHHARYDPMADCIADMIAADRQHQEQQQLDEERRRQEMQRDVQNQAADRDQDGRSR